MKVLFPKPLKLNDSVRVLSPSANVIDEEDWQQLFKDARTFFDSIGLKVTYSKNYLAKDGYLAGTIEQRLADIHDAFLDQKVKVIISSQGGDNSNQLLPYLDYKVIKNNPKYFIGLSDITVLLNAIFEETGLVTFHGQDFMWGIGKNAGEFTKNNLVKSLFDGNFQFNKHPAYPSWKILRKGVGKGRIFGGCLPSFGLLNGTVFSPLKGPFIFAIEDMGQSLAVVDSLITQLVQTASFRYCQGIIIGNFILDDNSTPQSKNALERLIVERTKNHNFPILKVTEIGHCVENNLIPIGAMTTLVCTDRAKVEIEDP